MAGSQENEGSPQLKIGRDSVQLLNVSRFDVLEPKKGAKSSSAFSTMFPNFGLPKGVQNLRIKKSSASRIVSRLGDSLQIQSDSHIRVRGNEGVRVQGRELLWAADQDLLLRSVNGSIEIDGTAGIVVDASAMAKAPGSTPAVAQYKLCICMPQATLYRIPVLESSSDAVNCNSVDLNAEDSPCLFWSA